MATTECSSDGSKDEQGMADTYVVQRGDTLAGVALRLGVKQSELKRANHMYGSASLITGQSLKLDGIHQRKPAPTSPTEEVGTPSAHSPSSVKIETDSGTARRSLSGAGEGDQTEEEEELIAEPLPEEEEIWLAQDSQSVGTAEFPGGAVDVSPVGGSLSRTRQDDDDCKPNDIELLYAPPHWGEEALGGEGVGDGATSRGPSEISTSSTATAAGASLRGVLRYMFSPSSSAMKAVEDTFAELRPPSRSGSARGTGLLPAAAGGDEGSPSAGEVWGTRGDGNSARDDGNGARDSDVRERSRRWGSGVYSGTDGTGAASRGFDEAAAVSAAPGAVPERSTAQTLLSIVRPSYWMGGEEEGGGGGGGAAGGERGGAGTRPSSFSLRGILSPSSVGPSGILVPETMGRSRETWGDANEGGVMLDSPLRAASPPLEPEPNMPKPLKLPGLVTEASTIVTHSTLARLEAALPKHYRGYNWYLLYSTFRDGASYLQLYSRVKAEEPTYVLVENMKGEVFGGFATSAWSSGCQYYGTGECFLFKILGRRLPSVSNGTTTPAAEGHAWEAGQEEEGRRANKALLEGEITAYPWTGMNTYLQFSDDVGIGMGGGGANGSFGLFIGEDFLDGSTGTCDTFSNPPLCSSEHFEISQFEVWGFTTADSEMGARLERLRKTLRGRTTRPL